MNTIFTKLKTSATLWSVVGGFILGFANIVWGADSTASSISSAVMFSFPAVAYIVGKFYLRIKMADANKDGEISLQELAAALTLAARETSDEAKEVVDAFRDVINTLASQVEQENALTVNGEESLDKEGEK